MRSSTLHGSALRSSALWPSVGAAALLAMTPFAFATSAAGTAHETATPPASTQTAAPNTTTEASGHLNDTRARADALSEAKVSMSQAIHTAQRHSHGKALFARFELRHGNPYYLIRTYQHGQVWDGLVNADTGRIAGKGMMVPESKLDPAQMKEVHDLSSAHTSLTEAVARAQRHEGGRVLQAALTENADGQVGYDLQVVHDGKIRTAMINPQSGKFE